MDEEHVDGQIEENEVITGKKRKSVVLDSLRKLSNDQEKFRIKSCVDLLKHLVKENAENADTELQYTLRRLIQGLGASKLGTKTSFYSTLVTLLTSVPDITVSKVFEHVKKQLQASDSNAKSENADISTGQILVCGAIIRTGLFMQATTEEQTQILTQLVSAGKKRMYLYLAAVTFILDLCKNLEVKEFKSIVWPFVQSEISQPWSEHTIDTLYLLYILNKKYPSIVNREFLRNSLGTDEICCEENLKPLVNILVNIPRIAVVNHPFYLAICEEIAKSPYAISFLNEVDLLLIRLNYNRQMVTTTILTNIMKNVSDIKVIPDLLTKNYVQRSLQYFKTLKNSKNPEELQQKIYIMYNVLLETLKGEQGTSLTKILVLEKLIFYPGIFIFEKITRSKLVQQITALLCSDGVKNLANLYRQVVYCDKVIARRDTTQQIWINNDKIYAAQLLVKLLGHPAVQNDIDWKVDQLIFLANLSLFKDESHHNIGVDLAATLRDTFFRALDLKLSKLEDLRVILSKVVKHIDSILTLENNETVLRTPLTTEALGVWQVTLKLIKKIENKIKKKRVTSVFHILFLHMSLQLFGDVQLAMDSLNELHSCYTEFRKDKKRENEEEQSDNLSWIEVVTDLFLNLLSQNSHLLRCLITIVFGHLCPYINGTALHQILSVLDPANEENPLSALNDESESDSDGSFSDKSNDEDNESKKSMKSGNEADAENEDDESNDNSDVDDSSDIDENETVNDKLRQAVQAALGSNGYQTDEESIDVDQINETEGKNLDGALAQAFKQFKPYLGKKSNKQNKEEQALTHFRVRVLDLINLYLDSNPPMMMCVEIILPLLRLLEFCIRDFHQKPLLDRVRAVVKRMSNIKKFESVVDINPTVLIELLSSLLEKGNKSILMMREMGDKLSESCMFVLRSTQFLMISEEVDEDTKSALQNGINGIIKNNLELFLKRRDCLIPFVLFRSILQLNWIGNVNLVPVLIECSFCNDVRPFKRIQSLELLKMFYINHRLLTSNADSFQRELKDHEKKLSDSAVELLKKLINQHDPNIKERYIDRLLNLLYAVKQSPLKNEQMDWHKIGSELRNYRSGVSLSKDSKEAYNKLCRSLAIPSAVQMKDKVIKLGKIDDDENIDPGNDANDDEKKNKIKPSKLKNGEKLKLKKESQVLRMQSLSGGLWTNFSQSDGTIVNNSKDDNEEQSDRENRNDLKNSKKQRVESNLECTSTAVNGDELSLGTIHESSENHLQPLSGNKRKNTHDNTEESLEESRTKPLNKKKKGKK